MNAASLVHYEHAGALYSFTPDAWFNATEAAGRFGKRLDHWLQNAETLEYVRALDELHGGKPSQILHARKSGYVKTSRARADRGGGTWLHPDLAVVFARWLDVRFGVWCDRQIKHIIIGAAKAQGRADLIPLFLRPDCAPWQRRFLPAFYAALAKVTRTRYDGHASGTPCLFGALTDKCFDMSEAEALQMALDAGITPMRGDADIRRLH